MALRYRVANADNRRSPTISPHSGKTAIRGGSCFPDGGVAASCETVATAAG